MADKKERKKEKKKKGHFCSKITRLHEILGELRGKFHNTPVKPICLNCLGWTMLHGLHVQSYTLCTGRHFKPAEFLYMSCYHTL